VADRALCHVTIIAPAFPWAPSGGARTYYEHANGLARKGYRVSVLHARELRAGPVARLADIGRERVRGLRAGSVRRRVSWMDIDPRVHMGLIDGLGERAVLPPADLRIGTFWRTTEFLAQRPADGAKTMHLVQAYETFAGPAERVDAVWRLPIHMAVVSGSLRRKALDLGVPRELIHEVPNGIDHSVFHPTRTPLDRPPHVAFLAMNTPVKGLVDAVEVARRVHRVRADVRFTAFGGWTRPRVLPRFVDYVRAASGRELVERVYDRASVFLCTSRSEGFGFPSLEAMACGAALVSTRNGGVDEFATDGESAMLCDVGDVDALADAVVTLLTDLRRRDEVAVAGMRRATRFTWAASVDAFEKAVRAALESSDAVVG
jgi:glycosyltransferase involved in cell wall biosynthesis